MSRCFPFPPPGYVRNGSCGEALIESIKLQREIEKAKRDQKEQKRREKGEKRKERKEKKAKKEAASLSCDVKECKLIEPEKSSCCLQKGDDYYENEQLERSDITKEHDQPYSGPEPCCSDSTQSSNKRKRSTSPSSHDHGPVIKIRFSLKKHREPEESRIEDRLGSPRSVRNADALSADNNGSHHPTRCVTNPGRDQCTINTDSRRGEKLLSEHQEAAPVSTLLDKSPRKVSVYDSLFQNWVAPPLTYDGFESEDQDWLFSSRMQEERPVPGKVKPITGALPGCSCISLWPRAQYLPQAEIYALPYAIPF